MESISNSLTRMRLDLEPQSSRIGTIPCSPDPTQAQAIGNILDRWHVANGWKPLSGTDHTLAVAAYFEVLTAAGVPWEAYNQCYTAALASRTKRKAMGETVLTLSAEDLAVEWPGIRDAFERTNARGEKLLPENAASACQRCFGTGREEMPDGSIANDCSHAPLTQEDIEIRAKKKAEAIQWVRDAAKKIAPKPVEAPKPKTSVAPRIRMQCSSCANPGTSEQGWRLGEACTLNMNGVPCPGVMRVSDEAVAARG